MAIKLISFDLDNTLFNTKFDANIWDEQFPALVARKDNIPLADAKKALAEEYNASTIINGTWYDVNFWITKYQLATDWKSLHKNAAHLIGLENNIGPQLIDQLTKEGYRIILFTAGDEKFVQAKLQTPFRKLYLEDADVELSDLQHKNLKPYFHETYTVANDFLNQLKKESQSFNYIAGNHHLKSEECLHIGNDYEQDYLAPKDAGWRALHYNKKTTSSLFPFINNLDDVIRFLEEE